MIYYIIPYHIISYHIISYHIVEFNIIRFSIVVAEGLRKAEPHTKVSSWLTRGTNRGEGTSKRKKDARHV